MGEFILGKIPFHGESCRGFLQCYQHPEFSLKMGFRGKGRTHEIVKAVTSVEPVGGMLRAGGESIL